MKQIPREPPLADVMRARDSIRGFIAARRGVPMILTPHGVVHAGIAESIGEYRDSLAIAALDDLVSESDLEYGDHGPFRYATPQAASVLHLAKQRAL